MEELRCHRITPSANIKIDYNFIYVSYFHFCNRKILKIEFHCERLTPCDRWSSWLLFIHIALAHTHKHIDILLHILFSNLLMPFRFDDAKSIIVLYCGRTHYIYRITYTAHAYDWIISWKFPTDKHTMVSTHIFVLLVDDEQPNVNILSFVCVCSTAFGTKSLNTYHHIFIYFYSNRIL